MTLHIGNHTVSARAPQLKASAKIIRHGHEHGRFDEQWHDANVIDDDDLLHLYRHTSLLELLDALWHGSLCRNLRLSDLLRRILSGFASFQSLLAAKSESNRFE